MKEDYKILLVDDDPDILEFLSYNLEKEGYKVCTADNGKDAVKKAKKHLPDLILLDVMMPDADGIETCEEIRRLPELNSVVIAFLTARGEDYSQIAGFEAGADDYITKPIKPKVLISRIKALLKRSGKDELTGEEVENKLIIKRGDLVMDKEKFKVFYKNKELVLPKKEFALLELLISKPDKVFTREEIYAEVWGDDVVVGDRTIDVHIRKIREKISKKHIYTIKGVGYKYVL